MKLEIIKRLRLLVRRRITEAIYNAILFMVTNKEFPTMEMFVESILNELAVLVNFDLRKFIEEYGTDFLTVLFSNKEPDYRCEISKKILDPPDK